MHQRMSHGAGLWVLAMVLGCGPGTMGDGEEVGSPDDSTSESATSATSSASNTSEGPTTVMTTGTTTAADSDTGPLDTGVVTDLPETCSTFTQDCPAGHKCAPYADGGSAWNAARCVPIVEDPDEVGEPCDAFGDPVDGEDSCELGAMCWDVNPRTSTGVCIPLCFGSVADPQCPEPCQACTIANDGALNICLEVCDPLAQDCPTGQSCFAVSDTFYCAPNAGSDGFPGDPCEFPSSCEEGLACVDASLIPGCDSGVGCCTPFCAVEGPDPCDGVLPGTACEPWFEDPMAGPPEGCLSATIGACVML